MKPTKKISLLTVCGTLMVAGIATGCGNAVNDSSARVTGSKGTSVISAVGAESQYANVIQQIGGKYVTVSSIMSNPSTDPHDYEASTRDAAAISNATLVVQNGLGYDDFMNKLEDASSNDKRTVIDVATALGYSKDTKNPHLWYDPSTMPTVAKLVAQELEKQDPSETSYFEANLKSFTNSLGQWTKALDTLKTKFPAAGVAVTEPVADDLLQAAGLSIKTPWAFQAAIMNGVDPSPQDVQAQKGLFDAHQVKVFCYNQQAITDVTKTFLALAKKDHIPVVGVYETMPVGDTYQSWMEAEKTALQQALENDKSTQTMS